MLGIVTVRMPSAVSATSPPAIPANQARGSSAPSRPIRQHATLRVCTVNVPPNCAVSTWRMLFGSRTMRAAVVAKPGDLTTTSNVSVRGGNSSRNRPARSDFARAGRMTRQRFSVTRRPPRPRQRRPPSSLRRALPHARGGSARPSHDRGAGQADVEPSSTRSVVHAFDLDVPPNLWRIGSDEDCHPTFRNLTCICAEAGSLFATVPSITPRRHN